MSEVTFNFFNGRIPKVMTLQTQNLVMVGLGIKDDVPPNKIQPKLLDGVHLRWVFKKDLGFPWYGFYLFRREHRKRQSTCLSSFFNNLKVDKLSDKQLDLRLVKLVVIMI